MDALYIRNENGFREASEEEIITKAQTLISQHFKIAATPLTPPALTRNFLRLHLGTLGYEVFGLIYLDTHHRLIKTEPLFRGTLDSATVHVRDVVESVLANRAASVILYHNHPGSLHRATPMSSSLQEAAAPSR